MPEKVELACPCCGQVGTERFCPKCGHEMLPIAYKTEHDIIVEKSNDNISGFGYHAGCDNDGGLRVVRTYTTSDGFLVYTCISCGLRIVTDQNIADLRLKKTLEMDEMMKNCHYSGED
jgi:hypothetical protein